MHLAAFLNIISFHCVAIRQLEECPVLLHRELAEGVHF